MLIFYSAVEYNGRLLINTYNCFAISQILFPQFTRNIGTTAKGTETRADYNSLYPTLYTYVQLSKNKGGQWRGKN